jgi:hypothetical protein
LPDSSKLQEILVETFSRSISSTKQHSWCQEARSS